MRSPRTNSREWKLAVDVGTANVAAAHSPLGVNSPRAVRLGTAKSTMPSGVHVSADGEISVGEEALRRARLDTEGYVRSPLDALAQETLVVHGTEYAAVDLLAEVLREVTAAAAGSSPIGWPATLVLAHPVDYAHTGRLCEAALRMGYVVEQIELVPQPLASMALWADSRPLGYRECRVVVDVGAGSTKVSVFGSDRHAVIAHALTRYDSDWAGDAVDAEVLELLGRRLNDMDPAARDYLRRKASPREWFELRLAAIDAKERVSLDGAVTIPLRAGVVHHDLTLTCDDLEGMLGLAARDLAAFVRETLSQAGLRGSQVRAILLTGGGASTPTYDEAFRTIADVDVPRDPLVHCALGAFHALDVQEVSEEAWEPLWRRPQVGD